ncbi:peptidase MA family metallohydrolase [Desulforamulus hydrothermalis]|uniref:Peptidase MA-like domain-containing protein n=1 Tax=Desulforamulus hydrothermalis Lam5 = DSM 18033 TaxID=1121428 RepID=K8DZA9_9FIRM|nr:peptidase MA family metallohydrolase [Desulforamulus hydrothermalis]CCO08359.1 conserved hypothetical protein [Desulforamulus hydrothermalis Lam5 = DSM 18033]SHH13871.1 Peptidase MA superfamily protein [Desulforamulus hydrothermalis Lam5 = DSM 18033]
MPGLIQNIKGADMHRMLGITVAAFILLAAFFTKLPYAMRSVAYTVFREGQKQKALWTTRHMATLQSEHFIVRYSKGSEADAQLVLATAERFYQPIAEQYGYTGGSRVPVIVYPSRAELNRQFGWPSNESAMGVYWTGVIRVLSPHLWVSAADPRAYRQEFIQSGPMAHEFAHLVVDYVTAGNYTRWFTEGIAQYEEYKLTGFEFQDEQASLEQPFYPLSDMDRQFDTLPNQPLAYRQSYLAVRYVAEVYGEAALKNILHNLAQQHKIDRAFAVVLGVDMATFEQDYQRWARQQAKQGKL